MEINMNAEDKKLIADYMGWEYKNCLGYIIQTALIRRNIVFDLNDAGLVVEKMVEKGDWEDYFWKSCLDKEQSKYTAWLFNPDDFFTAMAAWLKEK
jgi:hypothetical protein